MHKVEAAYRKAKDKRELTIIEVYMTGGPVASLINDFDITHSQLHWLLNKYGVKKRPKGRKKGYDAGPQDRTKTRRVIMLRAQGYSYQAIADAVDCSRSAAYALVKAWRNWDGWSTPESGHMSNG